MKKLTSLIAISLLAFSTVLGQTIQSNSSEKEAEKMLNEFYTAYFNAFTEPPSDSSHKKMDMLIKHYCTEAFCKKIPEIIEQTDADVFLKAQDSDIKYLESLSISKDEQNEEYIVTYNIDDSRGEKITISIRLTLLKEGNLYKINSVR